MGAVGPGLGCPVSVGELDGTKDALGWLDGEFEMLGGELGMPSNPLSLAPSPSLSKRLNPPPPILELSGSFALASGDSAAGSKQKDPAFSTNRHSRPRPQSMLLLQVVTHFSSAQWPEKQSLGSLHVSPSSRGRRQVSSHRPVMQSTLSSHGLSSGILHTRS